MEALLALRAVEVTGRGALEELRRILGLLRDDDGEGPSLVPAPGVADLGELAGTVRGAGIPVALAVTGDAAALPPAASLTVYRIVQEALTNVVKHARGAQATVRVRAGSDGVLITVTDNGRGAAEGAGAVLRRFVAGGFCACELCAGETVGVGFFAEAAFFGFAAGVPDGATCCTGATGAALGGFGGGAGAASAFVGRCKTPGGGEVCASAGKANAARQSTTSARAIMAHACQAAPLRVKGRMRGSRKLQSPAVAFKKVGELRLGRAARERALL